jgi:hypothetical protein
MWSGEPGTPAWQELHAKDCPGDMRPELSLKLPAGILCVMAGTFRTGHQPKH